MQSRVSSAGRSVDGISLPPANSIVGTRGAAAPALTTAIVTPGSILESEYACVQALASASHPPACAAFDATWIAAWLAAFDPQHAFFLCAYEGRRVVGLAALRQLTEAWHGCQVRVVESLTNIETYRFDFLSGGRIDVAEHLWDALCASGRADVIRLDHIPERSPTLTAALSVARQRGWRAVLERTFLTPWRTLSISWDHELPAKFKANLRHRERRLERRGVVSFDVAADRNASVAIEAFYRLEASGWKGQQGTAVAQQPGVKRLYDGIVARGDDVLIPILSVGTVPIAAQVLRVRGRVMFLLKTAYDEAYSECAPGHLLTARVLRYGVEHGMIALDFLADNVAWKEEWASGFLPHHRIILFAPTRAGRYAYWARYGIRAGVKRVPGARRLVRWIRGQP